MFLCFFKNIIYERLLGWEALGDALQPNTKHIPKCLCSVRTPLDIRGTVMAVNSSHKHIQVETSATRE
jgi:hypothetical protein